ncbi:hypothetical protein [Myxococcus sp. RHSTA-1-4]|uniref:hypothetical protein n=1 Tax=Myxococcus sp. RHSTA-1-4 TaxID=2874601 RepID=UPI001CBE1B6F|nr:hypothetical protein [Myxococcus sp. RHSTA-1-4]MBZ4422343.1 hypothetical protein [Myxococcus sp. RHSTA-1-4]
MHDTRLLVTSIVRISGIGESSGYVRLVSRKERRVLATWPTPESPYRQFDLNPRGGLRGGRGIGADSERVVIAMTDRLFVFDRSWRQVGELTHPLFGEVHDILVEQDGVWVTASASDRLVKLGWDGTLLRSWSWRDDPALVEALELHDAPADDANADYRDPRQLPPVYDFVHLNGVSRAPEGLLLSFGFVASSVTRRLQRVLGLPGVLLKKLGFDTGMSRPSRTFALRFLSSRISTSSWHGVLLPDQGAARLVTRMDGVKIPNHNLLRHGDAFVFNDTHSSHLVRRAVDGSRTEQVRVPGSPAFARGLAPLGGSRFAVGSQRPAALYEIDFDDLSCEPLCELSTHPHECVYGIHAVPDGFGEPPARLFESAAPPKDAGPWEQARVA